MQSEIHTLKIKSWKPEELKSLTEFFSPVEVSYGLVVKKTALSRVIERIKSSREVVHASCHPLFGLLTVIEFPVLGHLTIRNLEEILNKNNAVIIPFDKNDELSGEENLCIIEVKNDEGNLPDSFLVASNGKYAEIKIDNFFKDLK